MTFNRFAGSGTLHALRTLVFRSRTAWLRRFQGRERDALQKDAPDGRPIEGPEIGKVVQIPEVGGLHHRYVRRAA